MTRNHSLAAIARAVASIPWGEARTVEDVLARNCGTCTGKHLLLQMRLREAGIECRPVVCTFRWAEQSIQYPKELWKILDEKSWEHGHNFLQVQNPAGEWIDLDITWDPPLAPYGFRTLPEDWDGGAGFIGLDRIVGRWDDVDLASKKQELINALRPDQCAAREKFLEEFVEWIASLRAV